MAHVYIGHIPLSRFTKGRRGVADGVDDGHGAGPDIEAWSQE
jgi:hypothetical protein